MRRPLAINLFGIQGCQTALSIHPMTAEEWTRNLGGRGGGFSLEDGVSLSSYGKASDPKLKYTSLFINNFRQIQTELRDCVFLHYTFSF
jgi:hypothetical protein